MAVLPLDATGHVSLRGRTQLLIGSFGRSVNGAQQKLTPEIDRFRFCPFPVIPSAVRRLNRVLQSA
jgi:hypothetical protein